MPTIQKIHVRYVNKKKLNDLLKSLFTADTYEFEENETDKTLILTVPRKLSDEELEKIKPDKAKS
ncbi:hypothetical protein IMSHALPRED_006420 [Imshaugia aleurites]|uniref:Uncharacterized protein n=1 Tax=Imshaugia aleurites TaxID=172621 RepID=A0A8H3IT32_9LECA|nr:hypothetical protein IMSHALPRED_006420 [Imshaugia aleurites]